MASLNKRFGDGQRFELGMYAVDVAGFSPFVRSTAPYAGGKAGMIRHDLQGRRWVYAYAPAGVTVATPTETAAVLTVTLTSGALATVASVSTAGAGYRVGERVPLVNGYNCVVEVATVDEAGGILTATVHAAGSGLGSTTSQTLQLPAMASTKCSVNAAGTVASSGTTHLSFAPFAAGEYGWVLEPGAGTGGWTLSTPALAASATTDGMAITMYAVEPDGNRVFGARNFEWWISEAATGIGLTADSYSGAVTATTGTILTALTAKKHFLSLTDANGKFVGLAVDSANPTDQYVAAKNPRTGLPIVSAVSGTNWEGA